MSSEPQHDDLGELDARVARQVGELLADALAARSAGNTRLAHALCNAVLALDPDSPQARAMLRGVAVRRQMTLLFCDLVGSTDMADSRDPEEANALLRLYRSTCTRVIARFDGWVDDHRGDGMLVLFGYPEVRESDARRGVLCGLQIIEELRRALPPAGLHGTPPLSVRIAVHTDLVVVDDMGISGATSNEAARLQALAAPDTVLVSDTTHALVSQHFETASLGPVRLRGVSRPFEAYTVRRERRPELSVRTAVGSLAYTGREPELARIRSLWEATSSAARPAVAAGGDADGGAGGGPGDDPGRPPRAGWQPAALLVTAPPGMGKTRLVTEAALALAMPHVRCACSQLRQNTSLHAFRGLLEQALGIGEDDDAVARAERLRTRVAELPGAPSALGFLATALDIPLALVHEPVDVDPSVLRLQALGLAAGLVLTVLPAGPAMLFVDDVHWADQSTLDLLALLLAAPRGDLLVLLAAREMFRSPVLAGVPRLPLEPLDQEAMLELSQASATGVGLSAAERQELVERSDGVPLFLEELLRTVALTDRDPGHRATRYSRYQVPQALRDPLLARLSLPAVDLDLAQAAATIGRDFDRDLLARLVGGDPAAFDDRLATLFDAELLESSGDRIRFRHELIREIAYDTQAHDVLVPRHSRIADQLLGANQQDSLQAASELAFHLERAQRYGEAVQVHVPVAQGDTAVGSHVQACQRLTGVLGLLDRLPADVSRQEAELSVRQLRSFNAVMAQGYAAPEAAEDYPRCVDLCRQLRPASEVVSSLIRTWSYYAFRGDLDEADRVAGVAIDHARLARLTFPTHEMAHGLISFFRGDFRAAATMLGRSALDESMAVPRRPPASWPLPNDPLAAVHAHLAAACHVAGQQQESARWFAQALDRCDSLDFPYGPFSRCYVSCLLALVRNLQGDPVAVAAVGREVEEVAARHGFAMWQLAGSIHRLIGAVQTEEPGLLPDLVALVDVWRSRVAADVWTPYWLTEIARAQRVAGDTAAALATLDSALVVTEATGSAFYHAETLRQRAELRIERGQPGAADELAAAAALARRQGVGTPGLRGRGPGW